MVDPSSIGGQRWYQRTRRGNNGGGNSGDGTCDGCDVPCDVPCDIPCDLPCDFLLGVSLLGLLARHTPHRPPRRRVSGPAWAGVGAIRAYQKMISPRLPVVCRHTPSCSAYGAEAVRRYGLATGVRLAAGRISRCTVTTPHGTTDEVP